MKTINSSIKNMTLVMTLVALITAGLLSYVNSITQKPIELQKQKAITDGIGKVMRNCKTKVVKTDSVVDANNTFIIHSIEDSKHQTIGAAIESETQGFGGLLKIMVGFDKEGTILGYTILESSETPGLGAKADTWFQKEGNGCIVGKNPKTTKIGVTKGGEGDIDAITASTITSRAFLKAVQQAYDAYMNKK